MEELEIIKKCAEINEAAFLESVDILNSSNSLNDAYLKYNEFIFNKSALFEFNPGTDNGNEIPLLYVH